jgi:nitroreductase
MEPVDTLETLLAARYGSDAPNIVADLTETLRVQLEHKSVRTFLDTPVTDDQLRLFIAAAQSASTSSSLQMWSVVAVRDTAKRKRIAEAIGVAGKFIETAPVVLFWVLDYARADNILREQETPQNTFDLLESTVTAFLDIGIASQNVLLAAESSGLGGVYAGSIRNDVDIISRELNLPKYTFPVVGLALGYPDPTEPNGVKPRLPQGAVLHFEQYDENAWRETTAQYDLNFGAYYATQGSPNASWKRTLAKRLGDPSALHGREQLRQKLTDRGLDSK